MEVKQKSLFYLTSFLGSEKFYHQYESPKDKHGKALIKPDLCFINPFDISILLVSAKYLDMKRGICCLKQENFARETKMSIRQFKLRSHFLVHNEIIFRFQKGKIYFYEYGKTITGIDND